MVYSLDDVPRRAEGEDVIAWLERCRAYFDGEPEPVPRFVPVPPRDVRLPYREPGEEG
jgi:hypothetical protein